MTKHKPNPKDKTKSKPRKQKPLKPVVAYPLFLHKETNLVCIASTTKAAGTLYNDPRFRVHKGMGNHQKYVKLQNVFLEKSKPLPMRFDNICQQYLDDPRWLSRGMYRYFLYVKDRKEIAPIENIPGVIPVMECYAPDEPHCAWVTSVINMVAWKDRWESTLKGDYRILRQLSTGRLFAQSKNIEDIGRRAAYEECGHITNATRHPPMASAPVTSEVTQFLETQVYGNSPEDTEKLRKDVSFVIWKNFRGRTRTFPINELMVEGMESPVWQGGDICLLLNAIKI